MLFGVTVGVGHVRARDGHGRVSAVLIKGAGPPFQSGPLADPGPPGDGPSAQPTQYSQRSTSMI